MKFLLLIVFFNSILISDSYYYSYGEKKYLKPIKDTRAINGVKYYSNEAGQKIGVKNEILIKCKKDVSCLNTVKRYAFKSVQELTSTMMLVELTKDQDPFELSVKLHNESDISFAHPNFIKKRFKR